MKIYVNKYYHPEGYSWISCTHEHTIEQAISRGGRNVEQWDDGTTFETLTFKQIED